jgi:hypothetical protein
LNDLFELSCAFEKLAGKPKYYDDYEEEKNYERAFKPKKETKKQIPKIEKLHNINDFEELLKYVKENLEPITDINITGAGGWVGSSRMVFKWDEGKVLKVAFNQAGLAQNFFEGRLSNQSELFTKVFDMHKRAWWILSEKIDPLSGEEDFYHYAGFPAQMIVEWGKQRLSPKDIDEIRNFVEEQGYPVSDSGLNLFRKINQLLLKFDLLLGDTANPKHWGLNDKNELKIYDYGLDNYVFDNHLETVNPEYFHEKKLEKAKQQDLIDTVRK